jgi:hypothetical protein
MCHVNLLGPVRVLLFRWHKVFQPIDRRQLAHWPSVIELADGQPLAVVIAVRMPNDVIEMAHHPRQDPVVLALPAGKLAWPAGVWDQCWQPPVPCAKREPQGDANSKGPCQRPPALNEMVETCTSSFDHSSYRCGEHPVSVVHLKAWLVLWMPCTAAS